MTENVRHQLFSAIAKSGHRFQARGAVASVTKHGARVATSQLFQARSLAGRGWNSTLNGRVQFNNLARTVEWLSRDILAGGAESYVAKISALVQPTRQFLVALNHA